MRKLLSKETIIIGLLGLLVIIGLGNYVGMTRAQLPGSITTGFWFMRRRPVPEHIKQGAREGLAHEINRLTMLSGIELGDPNVTDYIGNPVTWDQAQLDAVIAEISRLQALLDQFQ